MQIEETHLVRQNVNRHMLQRDRIAGAQYCKLGYRTAVHVGARARSKPQQQQATIKVPLKNCMRRQQRCIVNADTVSLGTIKRILNPIRLRDCTNGNDAAFSADPKFP